jgi:hypothetical protein
VLYGVKVGAGVLILRGVAAAHVAALETKAQMDPRVAHFQTFLAAFATGSYFANFTKMTAL